MVLFFTVPPPNPSDEIQPLSRQHRSRIRGLLWPPRSVPSAASRFPSRPPVCPRTPWRPPIGSTEAGRRPPPVPRLASLSSRHGYFEISTYRPIQPDPVYLHAASSSAMSQHTSPSLCRPARRYISCRPPAPPAGRFPADRGSGTRGSAVLFPTRPPPAQILPVSEYPHPSARAVVPLPEPQRGKYSPSTRWGTGQNIVVRRVRRDFAQKNPWYWRQTG